MKHLLRWVAPALLAVAILPAAAFAEKTADVKVTNSSDWEIHHFYMSPGDTDKWGPDQLGEQTIATDGTFTLKGVPCDTYDIKLVDEDGDECVVSGVDVCGKNQAWEITSKDLVDCEKKTAE